MSVDTLYNLAMQHLPDKYDKSVGTVISDLIKVVAILTNTTQEKNNDVLENMIYETASEEWKEKIARDRCNLERKQATYASGICAGKGESGAVINIGDKVATDTIIFTVTRGCVLDVVGTGQIEVTCDSAGSIGNVPMGAINTFPIALSGIHTVCNEESFVNGYNKEKIEEFDKRYYAKRQNPGKSGNKYHYKNWALEVTGVGDCEVLPRTPTRGTVTVIIIDGNKLPASEELVESCQYYIEEAQTVSADVIVKAAESVSIEVVVSISTAQNDTKDYTADIENVIVEYLKEIAFRQNYVSYAQIGNRILSISGILDYSELTINGDTVNISIPNYYVAIMGGITLV